MAGQGMLCMLFHFSRNRFLASQGTEESDNRGVSLPREVRKPEDSERRRIWGRRFGRKSRSKESELRSRISTTTTAATQVMDEPYTSKGKTLNEIL